MVHERILGAFIGLETGLQVVHVVVGWRLFIHSEFCERGRTFIEVVQRTGHLFLLFVVFVFLHKRGVFLSPNANIGGSLLNPDLGEEVIGGVVHFLGLGS